MQTDALRAYHAALHRHVDDVDVLVDLRLAAENELDQVEDLCTRSIMALHFIDGLTVEEVSKMFNLSSRWIYAKLRKE